MEFIDREGLKSREPARGASIYDYREPRRDWQGWLLDYIRWPGAAAVLDAGSGPGAYVPAVLTRIGPAGRLTAFDLSRPRLHAMPAEARVRRVQGDVQALPFPGATFDVALAMHMLYHVPDIPRAAAELRRVLRHGGVLLAATNALDDQPELTDLYLRCGGSDPEALGGSRFAVENGASLLEASFESIVLHERRSSQLVIPEAEPIVASFESLRYTLEPGLGRGVTWACFIGRVAAEAARVIAGAGAFRVREHAGLFICR